VFQVGGSTMAHMERPETVMAAIVDVFDSGGGCVNGEVSVVVCDIHCRFCFDTSQLASLSSPQLPRASTSPSTITTLARSTHGAHAESFTKCLQLLR